MTAQAAPTRHPAALQIAETLIQSGKGIWASMVANLKGLTHTEFQVVRKDIGEIMKAEGLKASSTGVYLSVAGKLIEAGIELPESWQDAQAVRAKLPKQARTVSDDKRTEQQQAEALGTAAKMGQAVYDMATAFGCEPGDVLLAAKEAIEGADYLLAIRAALKRGVSPQRIMGAITSLSVHQHEADDADFADEYDDEAAQLTQQRDAA
jgi:hypothetical protein